MSCKVSTQGLPEAYKWCYMHSPFENGVKRKLTIWCWDSLSLRTLKRVVWILWRRLLPLWLVNSWAPDKPGDRLAPTFDNVHTKERKTTNKTQHRDIQKTNVMSSNIDSAELNLKHYLKWLLRWHHCLCVKATKGTNRAKACSMSLLHQPTTPAHNPHSTIFYHHESNLINM